MKKEEIQKKTGKETGLEEVAEELKNMRTCQRKDDRKRQAVDISHLIMEFAILILLVLGLFGCSLEQAGEGAAYERLSRTTWLAPPEACLEEKEVTKLSFNENGIHGSLYYTRGFTSFIREKNELVLSNGTRLVFSTDYETTMHVDDGTREVTFIRTI